MKKQIGIWLDLKKADVIELTNDGINLKEVISEIEDYHVVGGSRSKSPWGPMDKVSESKNLERRKHQLKTYFENIRQLVNQADELYVFGPAETKNTFAKELKNNKSFRSDILAVESADSITENQKIAKVKAFFKR